MSQHFNMDSTWYSHCFPHDQTAKNIWNMGTHLACFYNTCTHTIFAGITCNFHFSKNWIFSFQKNCFDVLLFEKTIQLQFNWLQFPAKWAIFLNQLEENIISTWKNFLELPDCSLNSSKLIFKGAGSAIFSGGVEMHSATWVIAGQV